MNYYDGGQRHCPPDILKLTFLPLNFFMVSAMRDALLFLRGVPNVALGDRVLVRDYSGRKRNGQVIQTTQEVVLVQVFEG